MSEFKKLKTITKYEFLKHLRRKRLYAVIGLVIAAASSILVGLPAFGVDYPSDITVMAGMLSIGPSLTYIGAAFFAGDAIAGEFERRTGYILFPTPVKRTTLVIGKYLACYVAVALITLLGYSIVCASLLGIYGQIPIEVGTSLLLCLLFVGSTLSLTFFFSSVSKGAMGATVMTLAFIMIISGTIDGVLMMANQSSWFLLSRAGDAMVMVYPGFKEMTLGIGMGMPAGALEYDIGLCAASMATYLAVCFLLSMFFTRRREML